jgi:hypothetical protein
LTYFESFVSADVDLDVDKGAIMLEPLEGVTRVTMLMLVSKRSSTIGEEYHNLMD